MDEYCGTGFLYLTEVNGQRPVRDVISYIKYKPIEHSQIKRGQPPIIGENLASNLAIITSPKESQFRFLWSSDGEAVAILHIGKPIAFVSIEEKIGFSKAFDVDSNIACSWSQARFDELFDYVVPS